MLPTHTLRLMPRRPTPPPPPLYRLLPASLDLEAHLEAYPPGFRPFRPDALVHLLHLLVAIPAADRKLAAELDGRLGYVPLGAVRLQKWLSNYNKYLRYCVETGLLETDRHHVRGHKSRWYRLGAAFRQGGAAGRLVPLRDPALLRTLAHQRRQAGQHLDPEQRQRFDHLLTWLDPARCPLRIDAEAALAHAARRYEQRRQTPDPKPQPLWGASQPAQFKDPLQQYHYAVDAVLRLQELDLHPGFDAQGRLYSALANSGKELRQFIRAEGFGPLVATDLSCSQPFLLTILLDAQCYGSPAEALPGRLTLAGQGGAPYQELLRKDPGALDRIRAMLPTGGALPPDVVAFRSWTSTGTFYQQLRAGLAPLLPAHELPQNERVLKRLVLALLYSYPERPGTDAPRNPYKAAFAQLLPTVYAVCEAFKQREVSLLPKLMQAFEAHLILDVIARRVSQELPSAPVFSIHDALATVAEHADRVEVIMREELQRATGLAPTLKRQVWQAPAAGAEATAFAR